MSDPIPPAVDIDGILQYLPHRYPFVFVDRVQELEPGQRAVAWKCVSANEPYFQGHFPGNPIMPGVLIGEAFAQVAGVIAMSANPEMMGKTVYLLGFDKIRFRQPVRPGDRIRMTVEMLSVRRGIWRFSCLAEVDGIKVADGELVATVR